MSSSVPYVALEQRFKRLADLGGAAAVLNWDQAAIMPKGGNAARGEQLAALGGVDMDKLCRLDEAPLRAYMRDILDTCMPKGRFVFGSGNTVTSYVPVDRYVWMLEEGRRWATG